MKRTVAGICIALAVILLLTMVGTLFVPQPYLHMQLNPDGSVNNTFLEPEDLYDSSWYASTYTTYDKGEKTGSYTLRRGLSEYTITKTDADGNRQRYTMSARTSDDQSDTQYRASVRTYLKHSTFFRDSTPYTYTSLAFDSEDNCYAIHVVTLGAFDTKEEEKVHSLQILYNEDGTISRQTRTLEDESYSYLLYSYTDGKLSKIEEFDQGDILLGYTEYTHDGSTRSGTQYTADGTVVGRSVLRTNLFGNPRSLEAYDEAGALTSKLTYRYSPFQYYLSSYGFIYGIIVILFAAFIAVEFTVNIEKRKKKKQASK